MTAVLAPSVAPPARCATVARVYRFELVKLLAQWRVRVLIIACWLGPAAATAFISRQSTLPADTLFGRWMHATGWAGPLVVLGFAGTWALPLLTSVIAGDVFSAEDRLGTWRHLLVAVRSPGRIFAAKALASLTVLLVIVAGLPLSGTAGGVLAAGSRPLVGLDGHLLGPGDAAGKIALAWVCALAPALALAAIGLLGSVALGRSPMGLLLPALAGLAMQMAQMLPLPVVVRIALPGYVFIAWNGLFTSPQQLSPLLIGIAVSLVWAAVATALAYLLLRRRDFTNLANDGSGRRLVSFGIMPLAALIAVTAAILVPVTGATGTGITKGKVQHSLATVFAHLYRLQDRELYHSDVTEAQLRVTASCTKDDNMSAQTGPGNNWNCYVYWHLPGVSNAIGQSIYQLDINANGRYVADGDGPKEVNGYFLVHTPYGAAPNPLWQFDGNVDLLSATSKG